MVFVSTIVKMIEFIILKQTQTKKFHSSFSESQLRQLFLKHGLPLDNNTKFIKPKQGMINTIFLTDNYVIKINTAHPELDKLTVETAIFKQLSTKGIPVPKSLVDAAASKDFPFPYIIMSRIPGETLDEALQHVDLSQREDLIKQCGQILGTIHHQTSKDITLPGKRTPDNILESEEIKKVISDLKKAGALDENEINKALQIFTLSELINYVFVPELTHGNYVFPNIMVEKQNISGIIDWEWSKFANSEEELALFLYRTLKTNGDRKIFTDRYSQFHPPHKDFNKRYLPYVLLYFLRLLPIAKTWTHRPDKQKEYFDQARFLSEKLSSDLN